MRTLEDWKRDFTHAARALLRAPGFTIITVVTLALAIGANTAIFSVVDAVLLDPLPFANADRLVWVGGTAPGSTDLPGEFGVSDEIYVQYRNEATRLEDLGVYGMLQSTARADDRVERLFMTRVTPSLFSTLGVMPALGRLPTDDDDENVAVISDWLWKSWFGADSAVIGRSYEMAGTMRTVIGVMEPEFRFPDERTALWFPAGIDEAGLTPGGFGLGLVGRLAPGADHETLASELATLAARVPEQFGGGPANYARIMEQHRPVVRSLEDELVGDIDGPLWLLLATVGIVLLIACANVANLFTARAEGRRQDLAVRRALGAGRAGLIRTQMAEAIVLAALGGAGGVLLAWVGIPVLVRAAPEGIPRIDAVGIDPTALLFTAGVSIVAAVAFGLLPAIRLSRPGLAGGLRQTGGTASGPSHRGRGALVTVQTASALVLLVASGLLVQSFWKLSHVDPGFDTEDIFTFQIAPTGDHLVDGPSYAQFHYDFMERLAALPGVESVGLVNELPLDEGAGSTFFTTEEIQASGAEEPLLRFTFAGGDYFETMGIDLLNGRVFDRSDHGLGPPPAVISRSTAELLWPGENPIGRRLQPSGAPFWATVVGVVDDVLLDDFRRQSPEPMVYLPMVGPEPMTWGVGSPAYVVKSPRAEIMAPEVRELVRQAAPNSPMYRIFTMRGLAARSMAQLTFTMLTLGIAAALALILAIVGLYGVLSYVVSQRTREIALRMALGAKAPDVRRMVVLQGGRVTVIGVVLGLVAAFGLTRVLESLLFGVEALDPVTFAAIAGLMVAIAALASYLPARRASAVDPMRSLRAE